MGARGAASRRLLADDYSSTGQLEWRLGERGLDHAEFWDVDLIGQLRFDTLTSETIVVPDTHLFDGSFFLAVKPAVLIQKLGRGDPETTAAEDGHLPIEFRARSGSLAASLADLLRRGDGFLSRFVFKVIEDEEARLELADELSMTPEAVLDDALAKQRDPVRAVTQVLRQCLDARGLRDRADEAIGPLAEGWSRWLAAESAGRLQVAKWEGAYRLPRALEYDPLRSDAVTTEAAWEALALVEGSVEEGAHHRGDVTHALARLKEDLTEREAEEVDIVEKWYSRGRYRAIAWQHGAACAQANRPWLRAGTVLQSAYRASLEKEEQQIPLPPGVLSRLGRWPSTEFRRLTFDFQHELWKWWTQGDVEALKPVAEALATLDMAAQEDRNRLGISEWVNAVGPVPGGAAGFVFGGPVGAAVGTLAGVPARILTSRFRTPDAKDRTRDRILESFAARPTD